MVEHYSSKSDFANTLQKFQSAEQQRIDYTLPAVGVKKKSNAAIRYFASKSEEALKSASGTDTETEENGEKQGDNIKIRQWPRLQGSAELGINKPIPALINKTKTPHSESNSPTNILPPKIRNSSDGSLSSNVSNRRQVFESSRFENNSNRRTQSSNSAIDSILPSNLTKFKSTASSSTMSSVQSGSTSEEMNYGDDDRLIIILRLINV